MAPGTRRPVPLEGVGRLLLARSSDGACFWLEQRLECLWLSRGSRVSWVARMALLRNNKWPFAMGFCTMNNDGRRMPAARWVASRAAQVTKRLPLGWDGQLRLFGPRARQSARVSLAAAAAAVADDE